VQQFTLPFVAGALLQVLLRAMSYLLPVTRGAGPRATTAALAAMSRSAAPRVVAYHLAVAPLARSARDSALAGALFSGLTLGTAPVASVASLSRVVLSLLAFAVLVSFVVLLVLAVSASRRNRSGTDLGMPPAPGAGPGAVPERTSSALPVSVSAVD